MSDNKNIRTPENSNSGADKNAHVQYTAADKQVETIGRSLRGRLREVKTTRWIRFAVVSVIFFLWVIWMGNPWLMFVWIILADIYLTCYIPWNWWKKSDNKLVRTLMNWVDAIVYALILVYFIFAFIGQNYTIPSSSLEKSLLVGDYLWVNKAIYGPRVPQTPLHFPLTQHTLPIVNTQSYFTNPQLDYHRLPGVRSVERGDIVVFNYPQGDTVVTGIDLAQGDYYEICARLRGDGVTDPRRYILENPGRYGELKWRPVDRRENYVKRAVGLPGERLMIVDDVIYINGRPISTPGQAQFKYIVAVSQPVSPETWRDLGVRLENQGPIPGFDQLPGYAGAIAYSVPLTPEKVAEVSKWPTLVRPLVKENDLLDPENFTGVFPLGNHYGWTRSNMGELWIPQRGKTLKLTLNNLPIYRRAIETYEGNRVDVRNGQIYINGKPADTYTFRMDYYWMMGDNRDWSADSRYWGFVPEDHVIGSPIFILVSFDEERGWGDGKVRWDRIFRSANPDKKLYRK